MVPVAQALILSLSISACSTVGASQPAPSDATKWDKIETLLGKPVLLCGAIPNRANLYADQEEVGPHRGVSLIYEQNFTRWRQGEVCVRGTLEYIGCGVGEIICTDAAFPYAIRVSEIVRR